MKCMKRECCRNALEGELYCGGTCAPEHATKFDEGKLEFSLLDMGVLTEVIKVLQSGSLKYGADNWRGGFIWSRPYNALLRHVFAWWGGEKLDPETGFSHLAHAISNLIFLLSFEQTGSGTDNRPKGNDNG